MSKKIPENWIEIELSDILKLKNGFAFKSKDYTYSGYPVIRISDIQEGEVTAERAVRIEEFNESYQIKRNDVLIAMSGATTGKVGIYNSDEVALQNQRVGKFDLYSTEYVIQKNIYYFLLEKRNEIEKKAYGGAQPNISTSLLESLKFPLAPLNEQKRIAQQLDAIFEKLNQNKTRLERIPQLLKDFRQTVLQAAVTGELTKEWREENEGERVLLKKSKSKIAREDLFKKLPSNWILTNTETISTKITDGEHLTPKRLDKGKMLLSAKNVRDGYIDYNNHDFISNDDFVKCLKRCNAEQNDILIVSVGATIGRTAIVRENKKFALVRSVALIKPNENILGKYLMYVIQSEFLQNVISELSQGVAQPCLYINKIKLLPIPLPPIEEQKEIISKVEELFNLADAIEQKYEQAKTKIEYLPQAILAKAFRGELVEQDLNDEPASELLKKIRQAKKVLKNTKVRKIKTT